MKILLTHKDCLGCKEAKEWFIKEIPSGIILDLSIEKIKPLAKKIVKKYGIKEVPSLIEIEDEEKLAQIKKVPKVRMDNNL